MRTVTYDPVPIQEQNAENDKASREFSASPIARLMRNIEGNNPELEVIQKNESSKEQDKCMRH